MSEEKTGSNIKAKFQNIFKRDNTQRRSNMVAFDGRVVVLSLRIAQAVLAVIELALTAYGMIAVLQRRH